MVKTGQLLARHLDWWAHSMLPAPYSRTSCAKQLADVPQAKRRCLQLCNMRKLESMTSATDEHHERPSAAVSLVFGHVSACASLLPFVCCLYCPCLSMAALSASCGCLPAIHGHKYKGSHAVCCSMCVARMYIWHMCQILHCMQRYIATTIYGIRL